MKCDPLIEGFSSLPVQAFLNMPLDVNGQKPWQYEPNELHFTGCPIQLFRQFRVRSIRPPTWLSNCWMDLESRLQHSVESENTCPFILIIFAAGSLSNEILDHRKVVQSCKICMLYVSLRTISFSLVVGQTIKSCDLGKLLFIAILVESSSSFVSQDEIHQQSLAKGLQNATLIAKILSNSR